MSREAADCTCAWALWTVVVLASLLGYVLAWLCWKVVRWKANRAWAQDKKRRARRRRARAERAGVHFGCDNHYRVRRRIASISMDEPDASVAQQWSWTPLTDTSQFPPSGLTPSQARMLRQQLKPSLSQPDGVAQPHGLDPRWSPEPEFLEQYLCHWRSEHKSLADSDNIPVWQEIGPLEEDRRGPNRPVRDGRRS